MGAAIHCDCGRQLVPAGGEQALRCSCGRVWQALVHTRTTAATAWIPSAAPPRRQPSPCSGDRGARRTGPALSVLRSIPGRVSLVPALWPARRRPCEGRTWQPRLVRTTR